MANGHGVTTIDFGATPIAEANFTVTDAAITSGMSIECWINAGDSTADNDTGDHAHAAASMKFAPSLGGAGSFTVDAYLLIDLCTKTFKMRYAYAT